MPKLDIAVPVNFLCHISRVLMQYPVYATDGYTYERQNIEKWVDANNASPVTGKFLTRKMLMDDGPLESKIGEFIRSNNLCCPEHLLDVAFDGDIENLESINFIDDHLKIRSIHGDTPLHLAVSGKHAEIVETLLKNGADIEDKNGNGKTPLHVASYNGDARIAEILMKNGAKLEATDRYGSTALLLAVDKGHENVVDILLQHGANVNSKLAGEFTALHCAAMQSGEEKAGVVKSLLRNGARIDAKDGCGTTPLHFATRGKNREIIKLLIENGADFYSKDMYNKTPIDYAEYVDTGAFMKAQYNKVTLEDKK